MENCSLGIRRLPITPTNQQLPPASARRLGPASGRLIVPRSAIELNRARPTEAITLVVDGRSMIGRYLRGRSAGSIIRRKATESEMAVRQSRLRGMLQR